MMIVKNAILYVVIGVFYGAEFNFTGTQYLKLYRSPIFGNVRGGTFMAKNAPKMPILFKKTFFGA